MQISKELLLVKTDKYSFESMKKQRTVQYTYLIFKYMKQKCCDRKK